MIFIKKLIFTFILSILLTASMPGCSSTGNVKEPPEISISAGDKSLDYVVAKNKWDGSIYDREDTFISILKEQKEIPVFENNSVVEISFKSKLPDKFTVADILIDENGKQLYTDKEIKNVQAELKDGKYYFAIEPHFASSLSSYYDPEKKEIRGFRMTASWGGNECEYAFLIKTHTE